MPRSAHTRSTLVPADGTHYWQLGPSLAAKAITEVRFVLPMLLGSYNTQHMLWACQKVGQNAHALAMAVRSCGCVGEAQASGLAARLGRQ